jgi:hypothetical protein
MDDDGGRSSFVGIKREDENRVLVRVSRGITCGTAVGTESEACSKEACRGVEGKDFVTINSFALPTGLNAMALVLRTVFRGWPLSSGNWALRISGLNPSWIL